MENTEKQCCCHGKGIEKPTETTIEILGTKYRVVLCTDKEHSALTESDGCCDFTTKTIYVRTGFERDSNTVENLAEYQKKVLTHEIVHAFLYESGLANCSDWAYNEEIVDWIAIQLTKIFEVRGKAVRAVL